MIGEKLCYAIVYLAEAVIALWYCDSIFARRKPRAQTLLMFFAGYALLYGVSLLDVTVLNTVSFFAINLILLYVCYHCAFKTAILHSAFLTFVMTIAEVLIALVLSLFVYDFGAYTYNFTVMVIMAILSKFLYLIFALIGAKVFTPHKQAAEEPKRMLLFCLLPVVSAILSVVVVYLGLNSPITKSTEFMMLVTILSLFGVNLIFLALYNYIQQANAENLALQLSIQKEEADAVYYQSLQEQRESECILIHDIKNHLRTIEGLAAECNVAEITDYIEKLESTFLPSDPIRCCSDPILNLLLMRFDKECREKQIEFKLDVRENCTRFMDAPSITTLFGNLLSNAVEAASVSQEKQIEFSVTLHAGLSGILISVMNSCDTEPVSDNFGRFRSRKASGIHGVGLKSIERVVEKYDGISTMYYDKAERKFHHIIRFPE